MSDLSKVYKASVHPVYIEDTIAGAIGEKFEYSTDVVYTAETPEEACKSALRYAARHFKACGEGRNAQYVGCVKVWYYHLGPINTDGRPSTQNGFGYVLEWKCDTGLYWPKSPDAEIRSLVDILKALTKADWVTY